VLKFLSVCVSLAGWLAGCGGASRPNAGGQTESDALRVTARVEHLDTLVREPMLAEHPSGALFVTGYNRRRPRLWRSTDGGATWATVDVGGEAEGAVGNSDVDLAVAPDGTIYFLTMGFDRPRREGTHVAIGVSHDVGASWRWTMLSKARFDDRPWVEVAPDGVAHVIWNDGKGVNHALSRDRGATWMRMARVYDRGGSSHLAIGPRGEIAVRLTPGAASGNTCDEGVEFVAVSTDGGMTWQRRAPPGGTRPSGCLNAREQQIPRWVDPVAWDSTGALYALWTTHKGVWVGRSPDNGVTWSNWRIAQDSAAYFPYLAARGRGELAATWVTTARDTVRWQVARVRAGGPGAQPIVALSERFSLESWVGDPPSPDAGGEYLATAVLRDGSVAVVTPVQHESARRLGFTWWRFTSR
jgi:hypothetical protein